MKIKLEHKKVFKAGSTTYFNSSIFFPPYIRQQVFALYSFVRVADDYVDQVPQDVKGFQDFRSLYRKGLTGETTGNMIIDDFIALKKRKKFPDTWVDAFLASMEADLYKKEYDTLDETLEYIYGSAEVIGLFMSSIMNLDERAEHAARMLGRAMQYINFIRDINEDLSFGRRYLPLTGSALNKLDKKTARKDPASFNTFIKNHLELYRKWQDEAEAGYKFIPKRYRVAIKTAGDMYNWTARKIAKNPLIVFEKKCKPKKMRIILQALWNGLRIGLS